MRHQSTPLPSQRTRPHRLRVLGAALLSTVLSGGLLALAPTPSAAAGNGEWAVTPTPPKDPGPAPRIYFFLESPPGQTVIDSVRVVNMTDAPKSFQLYGADAYNTERDGGFGLRARAEPQTGVGSWAVASVTNLVVPARTQSDIPFTVTVPANATPGDHVGGIVAIESTPGGQTRQGGVTVNVQRAVAARVYLRVAGPTVPSLEIEGVRVDNPVPLLPLPVTGRLSYTLANTGNLHLAPKVAIASTGLFGHAVGQSAPVPQTDLVPGARTAMGAELTGLWPFDLVTTTVTVEADGGVRAVERTRAVVLSWPTLAFAVLLATGLVLYLRRRRRGRVPRPRRVTGDPA